MTAPFIKGALDKLSTTIPGGSSKRNFNLASSILILIYSTCHPCNNLTSYACLFLFHEYISCIASEPSHRKYPTGEKSHNKAVSLPITIFHGWEGRKGMDDMHFLLLKTEESPFLLTKGPNIRISCTHNKLCYYLSCTKQFGFY